MNICTHLKAQEIDDLVIKEFGIELNFKKQILADIRNPDTTRQLREAKDHINKKYVRKNNYRF